MTEAGSESLALDRDALALHTAVAELVRVYQFFDRDHICCHNVSVTQCHALETLVAHGPMRLIALAQRLFLDKSTTSRVIGALVRKGYVVRRTDASDRRATTLSATRRGQQLCACITEDLVAQHKSLLNGLDPAVRAGVIHVVRGLVQDADARFRSRSCEAGTTCCTLESPQVSPVLRT